MHVFLGVLMGVIGWLPLGTSGLILGGVVGVLTAEVLALRRRIDLLEQTASAQAARKTGPAAEEEVVFAPPPERPPVPSAMPAEPPPSRPAQAASPARTKPVERYLGGLGSTARQLADRVVGFFTSGNLVLKIGIIILFFGVAFLLKYAAQRNMVPIEMRLAGVAAAGMVMLGLGWRLRFTRLGYGLLLQGGGVGILYLVVFAAARLYSMLPPVLALALMVGLVGLSCLLAVLQNVRSLAVSGIVGGFLAPVLMSTGGGSHVLLFSYFALLNAGICGIAWAKAWRELNLIGFFFTFAIGTLWGASGYRPEHFASTEPFLLLFFVFYVLIAILFALRQPVRLRGYIDGPLV